MTDSSRSATTRIAEAERKGWFGEVEGLKISLAGVEEKHAQIDRRTRDTTIVDLDLPTARRPPENDVPQPRRTSDG